MADEANEKEQEEAKGGGMMKTIIMGVVGLVLVGAGVFAGMTFMGGDEPVDPEAAEAAAAPTDGPAIYQSLHPPLVVNFKDELGDAHFMQITMEVMGRDQELINAVREHTPAIRNALILHLSASVYEEVTTREGKEQLLVESLSEINRVMNEQTGEEDAVEAVYFTALVIQ
jgi:flagellar FliL protein